MINYMLAIEMVGAVWLTIAIFMLGRNYRWWLFYAAANIPFSIVQLSSNPPRYWLTVMGCVLCLSGIRNYFIGKKKEKVEAKKEAMSRLR